MHLRTPRTLLDQLTHLRTPQYALGPAILLLMQTGLSAVAVGGCVLQY